MTRRWATVAAWEVHGSTLSRGTAPLLAHVSLFGP
jgi:hypothetical protein